MFLIEFIGQHVLLPLKPYTSALIPMRLPQVTGRKRRYFAVIGGSRSCLITVSASVFPLKTWKVKIAVSTRIHRGNYRGGLRSFDERELINSVDN